MKRHDWCQKWIHVHSVTMWTCFACGSDIASKDRPQDGDDGWVRSNPLRNNHAWCSSNVPSDCDAVLVARVLGS